MDPLNLIGPVAVAVVVFCGLAAVFYAGVLVGWFAGHRRGN